MHRFHSHLTPNRLLTAGVLLIAISLFLTAFVHPTTPPTDRFDAMRGFLLGMGLTLTVIGIVRRFLAGRR